MGNVQLATVDRKDACGRERHGVAIRICALRGMAFGARPKIAEAVEVRYICPPLHRWVQMLYYSTGYRNSLLRSQAREGKAWARRSGERYGQLSEWGYC